MTTIYDVETDVDAYVRGFLAGTLMVHKKKAPPKSACGEYYYTISDNFGVIEVYFCEKGVADALVSIHEYVADAYDFTGSAEDQVQYTF